MKIHKLMLNTFLELKNKLPIYKKQKTVVMQLITPQLMLELSLVKINKENLFPKAKWMFYNWSTNKTLRRIKTRECL